MQAVMRDRTYPFEYVVINDKLDEAVADVLAIVRASRLRYSRVTPEQTMKILG
jgi:guanylate kinase